MNVAVREELGKGTDNTNRWDPFVADALTSFFFSVHGCLEHIVRVR